MSVQVCGCVCAGVVVSVLVCVWVGVCAGGAYQKV